MKLRIWCDSGANHQSCREETYDIEDLGMTEAEWDALTEEEKNDFVKDIAFERLDWGFEKISLHNVKSPPTGDPRGSNSNKDVVAR